MAAITLYQMKDENNRVVKTLNLDTDKPYTGTFRADISVISPVFTIDTTDDLTTYNYCYITEFNRYYFINNIKAVRNGLWELSCHCDVLFTYSSGIKNLKAVVKRNENLFNLYINDNNFVTYNYDRVQTAEFSQGFDDWQFVLVTAGGGYDDGE